MIINSKNVPSPQLIVANKLRSAGGVLRNSSGKSSNKSSDKEPGKCSGNSLSDASSFASASLTLGVASISCCSASGPDSSSLLDVGISNSGSWSDSRIGPDSFAGS